MKEKTSYAKQRVKRMIILGIYQFQDPYYQGVAAQLAFFLFLSILPTLILLSQVLGLFSLSLEELQTWANINISGEGVDLIDDMLSYSPSGANSVFLAVTAVWAASRVQFALIRVTNYTLTDGASLHQDHFDHSFYDRVFSGGAGIWTDPVKAGIRQGFGDRSRERGMGCFSLAGYDGTVFFDDFVQLLRAADRKSAVPGHCTGQYLRFHRFFGRDDCL